MKKNILFLLIITILSTLNITAFAADKTEIEFSVGDETLYINKTPVTVVKPYVVGVGVTLVPVRVITEAFGAKVGWIEESQTVTLEYEDINITLQIGNTVAIVNGKEETLLSAPELTNSSTMVPLRFISEKFGATVSYDEKTEKITVIKEKENEETKKYSNEEIGISFDVLKEFNEVHSTENVLRFYKNGVYDEKYMLEVGIYNPETWDNEEKILNKHRERAEKYYKSSSIKYLDRVIKKEYNKQIFYEYSYELYYPEENIRGKVTAFSENGIIFIFDSRGISDEVLEKIYKSIDTSKINTAKTVNFKFNKENITYLYDKPFTDIKITLPSAYIKTDNTDYNRFEYVEYAEYKRFPGDVTLRCMVVTKRGPSGEYNSSHFTGDNTVKIDFKGKLESCGNYYDVMLGNTSYVEIDYVIKEDSKRIYCEEYIKLIDGIEYRFVVDYPELYYSDEVKQEIINALGRI